MALKANTYQITGMHCTGCEHAIEDAVRHLPGIRRATASYARGQCTVEYDPAQTTGDRIRLAIEDQGYDIRKTRRPSWRDRVLNGLLFLVLLAVIAAITLWGKSLMPDLMQRLNAEMGYAMLTAIGFLTGFHCIGMCGGLVVSYATDIVPRTSARLAVAHGLYGLGKTASYSLLGAGFGLLGSLVTFTPYLRGIAALAASVFLLIYALKMLDTFAFLRRFALRLPRGMARGVAQQARAHRNPLAVGLLSGLILGCGPLQAMYIMAAGTGSAREGSLILFFFGLGTLMPLISFGAIVSLLPRNIMHQLARVSGTLLILMALMMADRGLKLTGSGYDFGALLSHWQHCQMDEAATVDPAMAGHGQHQ